MTKNRTTQDALTIAHADHESLAAELKRMRQSLQATEAQLRLERRNGGDADKMHALAADVGTLRVLVAGQETDVAEATARVAELESAAEDELTLAEIAAGTVDFHESEQAHRAVLDDAERTLAQAIERSHELMAAASAAKTRARKAALALAAKHNGQDADMLARAVFGTEVPPMKPDAQVTKWPYGRRQTWRLVSQVRAKTMGVNVGEAEAGA